MMKNFNEIWKEVPFGRYEISSHGNLRRRLDDGSTKDVRQFLNGRGYLQSTGYYRGDQKVLCIHRLVAEAFLSPPPGENYEVNHRNIKKTDNHISNLEWVTRSENVLHGLRTRGRRPQSGRLVPYDQMDPDFLNLVEELYFDGYCFLEISAIVDLDVRDIRNIMAEDEENPN